MKLFVKTVACSVFCTAILLGTAAPLQAQVDPSVFATDLIAPQGIEVDDEGRIWVAEQGTGNDDGRISVVMTDGQVHPFLTGLPSNIVQGQPESAHHLLFNGGMLWATLGLGEESPEGSLLRIDTTGFVPGDPPLSMDDVQNVEDVGSFVLDHNFDVDTDQTNIYNMTFGPDDNLFIADASANAVIRREADTGALSVVAALPPVPNLTSVGPPAMQAVPTGIVFAGDRLYVSAFPGFPFAENTARIYEVELNGDVSVFHEGLTTAVDLTLDPHGDLVVAQFGGFNPTSGFLPGTGRIVRLNEGSVEPLASDVNFPAGIDFAPNGDLYIAAFADGQLLKVEAGTIGTAAEPFAALPPSFTLMHNYPNPFNPSTTIEYRLTRSEHVVLTVHDLLGQRIQTLIDGTRPAGTYSVRWDGKDDTGHLMPSGVYFYRMRAGKRVEGRPMHLVK